MRNTSRLRDAATVAAPAGVAAGAGPLRSFRHHQLLLLLLLAVHHPQEPARETAARAQYPQVL